MPVEELINQALQAPISQLIAVIILLAVAGAVGSVITNSRRESREINARVQSHRETASITKQQLTIIERQQEMVESINEKHQEMVASISEKQLAESAAWRKAYEINSEHIAQVASAITVMTAAVESTQRQIAIDFEAQKVHLIEMQGSLGTSTGHLTGLVSSMAAVKQVVDKILSILLAGGTISDEIVTRLIAMEKQLDRVVMLGETTNRVIAQEQKEVKYVPPFHENAAHRPAVPAGTDGHAGDGSGNSRSDVDSRSDPA